MKSLQAPISKDLVLIGGGHSHAIALKQLGMNPLPGVRVTLISNVVQTPYSGMLPAYIAGFYSFDQCHIDLRPLARFAGASLIVDEAIGLDLANNRVICANHPAIDFDVLSIDIGSTPAASTVPGAGEYAIPAKPISKFLSRWQEVVERVEQGSDRSLSVAIVGGGTGGVELALNMQTRLHPILEQKNTPTDQLTIHLLHRGEELMPERGRWARQRMQQILERRGIRLHLGETVTNVLPQAVQCASGRSVEYDFLFWVTQASAASWLKESGLATDGQGFVQVNEYLQSVSHPQVFAAGDVASMVGQPRPKAGVFAVRMGKPLVQNLRRSLLSQPLRPFTPQKEFLILIGTGDRAAVASRGSFGFGPSSHMWRWKDSIDRAFMEQFADLKPMADPSEANGESQNLMRCAGCGAKVGSSVLERSLARVRNEFGTVERNDIVIGLNAPDDAAVVRVPGDNLLVQTVDYFRSLIDDPFLFGQIAANHCLSDLFAMGATPQSALAIATLPYALPAKTEITLYQLLAGAVKVLHQAGAELIGGHTSEGTELAFGLTCNGLATGDRLLRKQGLSSGQVLILTKPLGTGVLFAADMRLQAKGRWIEDAVRSMLQSNQRAAAIFWEHHAAACTDVTGFGLVGHLLEMMRSSPVAVELTLDAIPLLDGSLELSNKQIHSSLYQENYRAARHISNIEKVGDRPVLPLLFDPQTSGGLLAAVPLEAASACVNALRANGYSHSAMIGRISDSPKPIITISGVA